MNSISRFGCCGIFPFVLMEIVGAFRIFSSFDCRRSKLYLYFLCPAVHVKFTAKNTTIKNQDNITE